ncbi:MAG: tetratricopeptide repeat protein [Leptospiraceae bacterium]|nr:tetratricopeptide repeat protein [Leptospiraceae bacterium]
MVELYEQGEGENSRENPKPEKVLRKKKYLQEMEAGNYALALSMLDKEINESPENPVLLYNFAICCSKTSNHKKSISILQELLQKFPRFIEIDSIYRLLIFSLIQTQRYPEALLITDERLKINVGDLRLLSFRAYILERMNMIPESIQIHKNILKIRPDYKNSLNSLAFLISELESPSEEDLNIATESIKKALVLDSENPAYLDTFGMLLNKRGNKEAALKALNKALSKSPTQTAEILDHLSKLI